MNVTFNETNQFIQDVQSTVTDFMIEFKRDIASLSLDSFVTENIDWEDVIRKQIYSKFHAIIDNTLPTWIKKMMELFLSKLPKKIKK